MLQTLLIALARIKVGIHNEICQIINSLFQEKQVNKKVYNNVMKSIR